MSRTIAETITAITEAARQKYGDLPPGWQLSNLYRDSPYLVVLDCDECNTVVGRWQVEDARLSSFGPQVLAAASKHRHWAR